MRIGIPRAFYYFNYPGLWETFFREIGMVPVVSGLSTKKTLELAAAVTETEHCLPHKLFDGHIASLLEKVDALFIPRIVSMAKKFVVCTKFGALPCACTAGVARGKRVITVDINEPQKSLDKTLKELGVSLGIESKKSSRAAGLAVKAMREEQKKMDERIFNIPAPRFLLLGHPYTLHDNFIAEPIIRKLKSLDVNMEFISFTGKPDLSCYIRWCTFNKIFIKLKTLKPDIYSGVIQITTFNCGGDSAMIDEFRRLCAEKNIPYLAVMVDEHSGQAGLDTRLEAFLDSLTWR
ncbi:MAG: hypothetical protein A2096_14310 [Spirochaetes bacterium GWF1_41_5]|nr:MAG: hypothetical protein A2096_14310 [Spirochaetes bacterium GWF1_41_5]